jgi:hypothetical protein
MKKFFNEFINNLKASKVFLFLALTSLYYLIKTVFLKIIKSYFIKKFVFRLLIALLGSIFAIENFNIDINPNIKE